MGHCLQSIHGFQDPLVFSSIAHQAVDVCLSHIHDVEVAITMSDGILDASLFVIMHILRLREKLAELESSSSQSAMMPEAEDSFIPRTKSALENELQSGCQKFIRQATKSCGGT